MDEAFIEHIYWWATPQERMVVVHARLTLNEWGQVGQFDQAVTQMELNQIRGGAAFWLANAVARMQYELLNWASHSAW
jgi:hypothetical protein